jgi:lipoprotein-releasing system permease protein
MPIGIITIYLVSMIGGALVLNLGGWWATLRIFDRIGRRLKFAPYVAVRHLRGRKSGFLTAIGVLSILGVSFSSCTLTTVLSVMGGFSGDLKSKILKTNAHVVIDQFGNDMENWQPLVERVRKIENVTAVTPIVQGEMMMNARSNNQAIMLKGIELSSFSKVSGVLEVLEKGERKYIENPRSLFEKIRSKRKRLYGGNLGLSPNVAADAGIEDPVKSPMAGLSLPPPASPRQRVLPAVIVGRELAQALRLYVGEEVNIISPLGDIGPTGPIPKSRPFRIGGVFFSGMYQFDSLFVYTSIEAAQKFLSKGNRISEIQITVNDPEDARAIATNIGKNITNKWRVRSWAELNASLFSALKLEKIVMFIFLSMAILVASFCIVATLTMLVLEKGAEVSVLMTLGSSASTIRSIFRFEGLLIGLIGTISGLLTGLGLCMLLENVGLPIDPEVWYIDRLPVEIKAMEFGLVGLASIVITQLATLYPAHAAARLTPVEGLKNE